MTSEAVELYDELTGNLQVAGPLIPVCMVEDISSVFVDLGILTHISKNEELDF